MVPILYIYILEYVDKSVLTVEQLKAQIKRNNIDKEIHYAKEQDNLASNLEYAIINSFKLLLLLGNKNTSINNDEHGNPFDDEE